MRFDMRMDDKPIRIKKGTNWKVVIMTLAFVLVAIACATSKYWVGDDREIRMQNVGNEITFGNATVNVIDYGVDIDKGLGEINLMINQSSLEDLLEYKMTYDGEYVYQKSAYRVIKGGILPNLDDCYTQEVLIQFSLPDNYWYLSLNVSQENNKTEEIIIDYRKMKNKSITDKGSDYLKSFDDINLKLLQQEKIIDELSESVKGYDDTIQKLESQIEEAETKLKIITDKKLMKEKQKIIDNDKKSLSSYKAKLTKDKEQLSHEKDILNKLQAEKESLR